MDRGELERLDRESLVARAQAAGVRRARVLTRPELVDELLRLDPTIDEFQLKRTRGFFGRARDLLSKVVERGLHLPDAADRLRSALVTPGAPRPEPQAVPTVTLAEIYAAQGHKARAIETLRRLLEVEPDHAAAIALLEKLESAAYVAPAPALPPENEEAAALLAEEPSEPELEAITARFDEAPDSEPVAVSEAVTQVIPIVARAPRLSECEARPKGDGYAVSWRLSERARRKVLGGDKPLSFVVRAVVIVPTWDGPKTETRDVPCDPAAGELLLGDCPKSAVVRIAIGLEAETFVPLAHASK